MEAVIEIDCQHRNLITKESSKLTMLTKRHIHAVKLTLPNTPDSALPTSGALKRASMSPAGTETDETSRDETDKEWKVGWMDNKSSVVSRAGMSRAPIPKRTEFKPVEYSQCRVF